MAAQDGSGSEGDRGADARLRPGEAGRPHVAHPGRAARERRLSVLGARLDVGHDIDPAKVERLVAEGATKANSAEPVAACQDLFKAMGKNVFHVAALGQGVSYAFENRVPRMLARDFAPDGTIDIPFKDQELETAFAKRLGVPVLLADVTQQVRHMARAAGFSKEAGSAALKIFERLAGITAGKGQ